MIETYFKANFVTGKKQSKSKQMPNYRQGLLIDLHGQSHPGELNELGIF